MRRPTSAAVLLAFAMLLAGCGDGGGASAEITIEDFNYSGADAVPVGGTVTITNEDAVGHTWTAVDGEFDSGTLAEGESFEFTFDDPGEYEYFCAIHPQMAGTISVEG